MTNGEDEKPMVMQALARMVLTVQGLWSCSPTRRDHGRVQKETSSNCSAGSELRSRRRQNRNWQCLKPTETREVNLH